MALTNKTSKRSDDQGFTLIEVLVVVVILGILAGIAVFAVQGLTGQSVQAACQSDYKSVEVAIEAYKAQEGQYPTGGATATQADRGITPAVGASIYSPDAVSTANGLVAGDTFDTPNLGPWLRDQPTNGTHYRIEASTDGTGAIQVFNSTGTAMIPAAGTHSIADCASVK